MSKSRSRNWVYQFVHTEEVWIETTLKGREFENKFLRISTDGTITVKGKPHGGYAWDGCSPKKDFLHIRWGTPDGAYHYALGKPYTYYASLFHDAIYQYKNEGVPITRKESDLLFQELLRQVDFYWGWLYVFAVRAFGGFYGAWDYPGPSQQEVKILGCSWEEDLRSSSPERFDR